jgi:transcriptional regulator with XRE-family HTH domain
MANKAAQRRLGADIERRREALEPPMNRKDFAVAIGVKPPTALGYERGEYMPGLDKLGRIAEVLKCTTDELLAAMRPPARPGRAAKVAAVALLVALLAACGTDDPAPAPDAAPLPACAEVGCPDVALCTAGGSCVCYRPGLEPVACHP